MKKVTMILLMAFIAVPLTAIEQDNAVITVPTGWTVEKAAYEAQWNNYAMAERYTALAELEARMTEIIPQLPENVYSAEDGEFVGYRIRLEQVHEKYLAEQTGWNYAEFAALLDNAETFVWYTEREKTLQKNDHQEVPSLIDAEEPLNRETMLQGEGWINTDVDNSFTDHITPAICSYDNYMFLGAIGSVSGYGDTVFLWRSTDYGQSWADFGHYGSNTADRLAFDVAIDPVNEYLYQTYMFTSDVIDGACWIRVFTDLNSSSDDIYDIVNTSDICTQPHLSVEHEYTDHRLACMYYNQTTDQLVIARSTDFGATWSTAHTTSWTTGAFPQPKGCQGATGTYDRFYFVAKKDANTFTVFESTSSGSGTWTETDYVHAQTIDDFDISAAHNTDLQSVVVAFDYEWSADDYNIRALFRTSPGGVWVSQLVDGYALMSSTPTISVDREWALNSTDPDYYHMSFYKDHDEDDFYIPIALRCENDSLEMEGWVINDPNYFEAIGATTLDTLISLWDNGQVGAFYQIDMTTVWNTTHNQWFPAIAWAYEWVTTPYDRDPIVTIPDENYTGVAEMDDITAISNFVTLSPNPAANAANLVYRLSTQGLVDISLFDATGRLVKSLVNEIQTAGDHRFALDNVGLAAGIYFVRVSTEQGTETETMTIIR
jgi:hypothetical protein